MAIAARHEGRGGDRERAILAVVTVKVDSLQAGSVEAIAELQWPLYIFGLFCRQHPAEEYQHLYGFSSLDVRTWNSSGLSDVA